MGEFNVEVEREEDGRWIGEVAELPGVLSYGVTRDEAEHGEDIPEIHVVFAVTE